MANENTEQAGIFYAKAAKERTGAVSCCGGATPVLASGYQNGALAAAPEEAVNASFGCGDPVAFSEIGKGQTVLDLGCGAGLDLIIAAEKVGTEGRAIGIDASEDMLALARGNIERAGFSDRIELRPGIIEHLPIDDASIDWVISNCVVNLSPDKTRVFREIHRVLKPGGSAIIADLVAENLPGWVEAHSDLYSACISGAVSEETYLQLANQAGLSSSRILGRMQYDENMVRSLISDALPIALADIAARLSMTKEDLLDRAGRDLADRIKSVKFRFDRSV